MVNAERGPCGGADANKSVEGILERYKGPSMSSRSALEFTQCTQGCDKVKRLRFGD